MTNIALSTAINPAQDFVAHVVGCRTLHGLEVRFEWLAESTVLFLARHPYGPWYGVTVFACGHAYGESENGSPMRAVDVATRLKRGLTLPAPRKANSPPL